MHFLLSLSCDWKLWLKALLQWRWCQVLKIRAFQPWRTATSNCKTHCCNYMLNIEVGGWEICPTTYLSPYSCCTQPYVLIPLTLFDFFSLSACKDASMSSSFSLFVLPIALSYVCTHAFLKKKCCIYFVVSFFFHLKWALVKITILELTYTLACHDERRLHVKFFWDHCTLPEEASHES